MKKLFLALVAFFSLISFNTGCSNGYEDGIYVGKYEEKTEWATYTADVEVTIKDGKIANVTLKDPTAIHSPASNWADHANWTDHYQELLDSYVGLDARKVVESESAPVDALAGATLSSDRLYSAIQNALYGYEIRQ